MVHLRHKIAQMLMMGFSGYDINDRSPVVEWLDQGLGGVLLFDYDLPAKAFGKNLRDKAQIQQLTHDLNQYAAKDGSGLPLLIGLDYEGGAVDRLTKIAGCMKTMKACDQALLSEDSFDKEATLMARTLNDLGFNLNFAPVVDLNLNEAQGIIGSLGRSFSSNPAVVARTAKQFVKVFHDHKIVCAYKHFPGHGSASGDTHEGFVDVTDSFHDSELLPFISLIHDLQFPVMVMTAHVINRNLDASGVPATLSYPILTELLRQEMGFNGVIVSDDLQMNAISHHYSLDDALRLTINAGADMIIFGNQLGTITATEVIDRIDKLVASGAIESARIDESYRRISDLKKTL